MWSNTTGLGGTGALGVAMPPKHHNTGPSYMRGGVVACPKRRHASSGFGPLQVTAALPCVEGGGTPRRRVPPLRTCHHTIRHVCGPGATLRWHCYPPSCLTLYHLTTGSSPLTLHGRALTSGTPHPFVLGQPIGTLWSNIRAKATARPPPCRPDASVSPLQVSAGRRP